MKTLKVIIKEAIYERLKEQKTVVSTAKSLGISRNTVLKYLTMPFNEVEEKSEDVCVE